MEPQSMLVPVEVGDVPTDPQIIERWQNDLDVRSRSKQVYERSMRQFTEWMSGRGLSLRDATRADIIAYRDHLSANYVPATVQAYLVPVRSLYRWAAQTLGVPSIAEGIRGPRSSKAHAKDALTREQVWATEEVVKSRIEDHGISALRDSAMYELLVTCGLRTIEVVRADVGDLRNIGNKRVLYVQGKGHDEKDEYVELPARVCEHIDRYLAARGTTRPSDPLFCGHGNRNHGGRLTTRWISKTFKEAMKSAGYDSPRLTAHSLRHTAVTSALLGGATLQEVQAMARHARIETTLVYSHNLDRLKNPAEEAAARYLEGRA